MDYGDSLMKIKLTLPITCERSTEGVTNCAESIQKKIEDQYGKFTKEIIVNDKKTFEHYGHLSIKHEDNNHTLWIFFYDDDQTHEGEDSTTKETVTQFNENVKKHTGNKPSKKQIENLLK
jgi:hypothetical protein